MKETETRACEIQFRDDETRQGPGRLQGKLLTYGERIAHTKGAEQFEPRSLQWGEDGVVFYDSHDQTPRKPVAIVTPTQTDAEARVDFLLPDSPAGRRIAQQVRSKELRGLSIEFRAEIEKQVDGIRRITKAWLTGLAAVANPAYSSATVEVREKLSARGILLWL